MQLQLKLENIFSNYANINQLTKTIIQIHFEECIIDYNAFCWSSQYSEP